MIQTRFRHNPDIDAPPTHCHESAQFPEITSVAKITAGETSFLKGDPDRIRTESGQNDDYENRARHQDRWIGTVEDSELHKLREPKQTSRPAWDLVCLDDSIAAALGGHFSGLCGVQILGSLGGKCNANLTGVDCDPIAAALAFNNFSDPVVVFDR